MNEGIRTKMSMLYTIKSKNSENNKENSNQNIPKINKNQNYQIHQNYNYYY